jgi:hypothetical protein
VPTFTPIKLGPGLVTIGETGTPVDFSCQVTACTVAWEVKADDPVTVLCGDSIPGARTYSAKATGTLFSDVGLASGIVAYSWEHKGETVPFVFVPNDEAATQVTGNVIMDPLSVGGDTAGANMTSDFDWAFVGEPALSAYVDPGGLGADVSQSEHADVG